MTLHMIDHNDRLYLYYKTIQCKLVECRHSMRDVNWSNGGIAGEHCAVWYHRDCARLNLSSFNRLAALSRIWICYKCSSKNLSHFPFPYSQLYLTASNSFDPLFDTNFTFEIDSFSSTTPFVPRIHSTPILNCPITLEPPVQNMTSTSTQANPPPAFSISSSGPESPPSVLPPELSSDFIYPKKGSNWRTVVINANIIAHKKAEISAMADYCDPDLMLITETKLDSSIFSSELLPKGYVVEFRRDRNLNGGGVMIVTKYCYTITDLVLQTTPQNETELVWATRTLKDHSKLVVGSFYLPPNKGGSPILELESQLSEITDTFRNNPKTTLILGCDFNAGGFDWETGLVPDDSPNRLLKEKLIEVISEAGLQQMQREPTRGQNLLDLFCCNKPSLVKACISIPGISDHSIVLADCDLKATINKKPPRKVYQWSKEDWQLIKERTVIFAKQFMALALTRTVKENYTVFY